MPIQRGVQMSMNTISRSPGELKPRCRHCFSSCSRLVIEILGYFPQEFSDRLSLASCSPERIRSIRLGRMNRNGKIADLVSTFTICDWPCSTRPGIAACDEPVLQFIRYTHPSARSAPRGRLWAEGASSLQLSNEDWESSKRILRWIFHGVL